MFKAYSQKGCLFDCRIKNALKLIGCIPWDYPLPLTTGWEQNGKIKICNSTRRSTDMINESDLAKFNEYMNSETSLSNCSCQPDCEEVVFETQVNTFTWKLGNCIKESKKLG